jgi:hypothetical protein
MGGARATYGRHEKCIKYLVGKTKGKIPLGIPRCRWEGSIRMYYRETDERVWIGFIWFRMGTSGKSL